MNHPSCGAGEAGEPPAQAAGTGTRRTALHPGPASATCRSFCSLQAGPGPGVQPHLVAGEAVGGAGGALTLAQTQRRRSVCTGRRSHGERAAGLLHIKEPTMLSCEQRQAARGWACPRSPGVGPWGGSRPPLAGVRGRWRRRRTSQRQRHGSGGIQRRRRSGAAWLHCQSCGHARWASGQGLGARQQQQGGREAAGGRYAQAAPLHCMPGAERAEQTGSGSVCGTRRAQGYSTGFERGIEVIECLARVLGALTLAAKGLLMCDSPCPSFACLAVVSARLSQVNLLPDHIVKYRTSERPVRRLRRAGNSRSESTLQTRAPGMSGLRDLVTGADGCTTGDGAGPSNAAASLADALLGRRAKQQAQLQEVGVLSTLRALGNARYPGYAKVPVPPPPPLPPAAVLGRNPAVCSF